MHIVLLVSKDLKVRQSLEQALDSSMFLVWVSYSLPEARTMLGQQDVSVIVIDDRLNPFEGVTFIRNIKLELGKKSLACVYLVEGNANVDANVDKDTAYSSGIDEVLEWPASREDISRIFGDLIMRYEGQRGSMSKIHKLDRSLDDMGDGDSFTTDMDFETSITTDPLRIHQEIDSFQPGGLKSSLKADEKPLPNLKPSTIDILSLKSAAKAEILPEEGYAEERETGRLTTSITLSQYLANKGDDPGKAPPARKPESAQKQVTKVLSSLTPERVDELAREMLDAKLTAAAKTHIRKLIAQTVQEELEKIIPSIVEQVKKQL